MNVSVCRINAKIALKKAPNIRTNNINADRILCCVKLVIRMIVSVKIKYFTAQFVMKCK